MLNSSLATRYMILYMSVIWYTSEKVRVLFKVHLSPPILNTTSYHLHRLLRVYLSHRLHNSPFNNLRLIQITSAAVIVDIGLLHVSEHDCQQMIYALFYPTKAASHNSFSSFLTDSTSTFCCGLKHLQVWLFSGLKSNHFMQEVQSDCSLLCIETRFVRDWSTGYQRSMRVRVEHAEHWNMLK